MQLPDLPPEAEIRLQKARALAALNRVTVAEGGDPLADKQREKVPRSRDAVETVHEANLPRWRCSQHAADWLVMLNRHAITSFGQITVDTISPTNVLDILTPMWTIRPETAQWVRQRIRRLMMSG